jgi:pyrimidine operon attenuation protein / uracil phosphoribosyltransferase
MTKATTQTPNLREKAQILSGSEIERTLVRLAHEIVEKNDGVANLGLVGIMRRGVPLAHRLAKILGRTTRAALDALFDHGRPRRIQMCVLIDRGHRELPIEASFVGRAIQTSSNEIVEVRLQESDGADKVLLLERIPEKK